MCGMFATVWLSLPLFSQEKWSCTELNYMLSLLERESTLSTQSQLWIHEKLLFFGSLLHEHSWYKYISHTVFVLTCTFPVWKTTPTIVTCHCVCFAFPAFWLLFLSLWVMLHCSTSYIFLHFSLTFSLFPGHVALRYFIHFLAFFPYFFFHWVMLHCSTSYDKQVHYWHIKSVWTLVRLDNTCHPWQDGL